MRLKLDDTWKYCRAMWKWIVKVRKSGSRKSVDSLKSEWLADSIFGTQKIDSDCFFCEYYITNRRGPDNDCFTRCPGAKIDPGFSCTCSDYHYEDDPEAFYKKIVQLDRIRKRQKKAKK